MDSYASKVRTACWTHLRSLVSLRAHAQFTYFLFAAVFGLSGLSFWMAYDVRFDFQVPRVYSEQRLFIVPYVALLKLLVFYLFGMHRTNWRYVGLKDIPGHVWYNLASSAVLYVGGYLGLIVKVPRAVILVDFLTSTLFVGGFRVSLRLAREWLRGLNRHANRGGEKQVVIIGAGDAGEMIIREIGRNPGSGFRVTAVFDDDARKQGMLIHGIKVEGALKDIPAYAQANAIHAALVAVPSATQAQMKRIYTLLKPLNLSIKTLPPLPEIIDGRSNLVQLRDLNITDLLGREEIRIDDQQVLNLLRGKVTAVTGAGGSIGSELCRQVLKRSPARLILMERSENSLFHVHRQLAELVDPEILVPLLCDITDPGRMSYEFDRLRPHIVLHAGAHKHVPLQELNPTECFRNNAGGTRNLARMADRFGVETFVLISTDKAINPTSVMGATKRVCEIYCQVLGRNSATRFLSVRFGNVLASEGSVIPIFLEQIHGGGPVTVTHREMKRYFMTIAEATTLVLQAATLGGSGQILILEMGEPVKIVDLVDQLLELVGKNRHEIPIKYIGLRPGEKLFEELVCSDEICIPTSHNKIRIYRKDREPDWSLAQLDSIFDAGMTSGDFEEVRRILRELVPEYNSNGDVSRDPSSRKRKTDIGEPSSMDDEIGRSHADSASGRPGEDTQLP